jgi:hypothetical protein
MKLHNQKNKSLIQWLLTFNGTRGSEPLMKWKMSAHILPSVLSEIVDLVHGTFRPMKFADFDSLKCPMSYQGYRSKWLEQELECL